MKYCTKCNNQQEQGNFCGVCGSGLSEMEQSVQVTAMEKPEQPSNQSNTNEQQANYQHHTQLATGQQNTNPQIDQLKKVSSNYFGSFVTLLKQPSRSLNEKQSFSNALISFVLFSFVIAFSVYSMINGSLKKVNDYSFGLVDEGLPIGVLIAFMLIMMIATVTPTVLIFLLEKIFVQQSNFKKTFIQVSNFYPVFIAIVAVGIILNFIGAMKFAIMLILISILFVILLLPLYVMTHVLKGSKPSIDPFFIYGILAVAILIVIYIVGDSIVSAMLEEIMYDLSDLFGGGWY